MYPDPFLAKVLRRLRRGVGFLAQPRDGLTVAGQRQVRTGLPRAPACFQLSGESVGVFGPDVKGLGKEARAKRREAGRSSMPISLQAGVWRRIKCMRRAFGHGLAEAYTFGSGQ
jgi:hypothetical protein